MTDLVDRLRKAGKDYDFHENALIFGAADEIERLRTENAGLVDDMNLLRDNNTALRARIEEMDLLRDNNAALRARIEGMDLLRDNNAALRAKIEAMEKQERFDADSDVFRSAFEAALKAGNWLRRQVGSKALVDHVDLHAHVKLIIAELLDRIEAAEKDIALKERVIDSLGSALNVVANVRDDLLAHIRKMERQEPVRHEFQGRDGTWRPFIDQRHYENTVADGSWPIRALYIAPGAQPKPDCGEAGHDEGRCGNAQCFSSAKGEEK